jgi:hypothetical protein
VPTLFVFLFHVIESLDQTGKLGVTAVGMAQV